MDIKDIKIGMKVFIENDRYFLYTVSKIEEGRIVCTDDRGDEDNFVAEWLVAYNPEADKIVILEIQEKINKASSLLDIAFKALVDAKEMAEDNHFNLFNGRVFAIKELEHTFESNGWSTSSLRC